MKFIVPKNSEVPQKIMVRQVNIFLYTFLGLMGNQRTASLGCLLWFYDNHMRHNNVSLCQSSCALFLDQFVPPQVAAREAEERPKSSFSLGLALPSKLRSHRQNMLFDRLLPRLFQVSCLLVTANATTLYPTAITNYEVR